MNDRFFDLLYKAEQREIAEKLHQRQLLRDYIPVRENEYRTLRQIFMRIWQALVSLLGTK